MSTDTNKCIVLKLSYNVEVLSLFLILCVCYFWFLFHWPIFSVAHSKYTDVPQRSSKEELVRIRGFLVQDVNTADALAIT